MAHDKEKKGEWKGYTLSQLEYRRALTLARIEMQKEQFSRDYSRVRMGNFSMEPSGFSRALGAMNYLDYAIMAFKVIKKIVPLFRRNRRS